MGKINVLGFDIANLIAAGEVVDRPASVVKELAENSIDAGATAITVEIRRGGTSFIRVSDNGCGIDAEDLPLTVLRHATSKIKTAADLSKIGTLGFRGEALAAIAAVCRLRILSKPKNTPMGTSMECEGGEITSLMETGCADGTSVVVRELFYNVPARRKFLKKDATEAAAVTAVVEKIAMSSPGVSVKYICDGEVRFMTAGDGSLQGTIFSVFGRDTAKRLIAVDRTDINGIRIHGYVSEPDMLRSNRNSENFFINGRFVKSKTATAAIEQAYVSRIPKEKFPFAVLNIQLNPEAVDVNVHPSKLEVKFANERIIFEAVYYAVLSALENSAARPELKLPGDAPLRESFSPEKVIQTQTAPKTGGITAEKASGAPAVPAPPPAVKKAAEDAVRAFVPVERSPEEKPWAAQISFSAPEAERPAAQHTEDVIRTPEAETTETPSEIPDYVIVGEAYNCYVIVQLEDRLLFIDKHAAHERILFDELCKNMRRETKCAQILMFPVYAELSETELSALEEYADKVREAGFAFKPEPEKHRAAVTEIPEGLTRENAADFIGELAHRLAEGIGTVEAAEAGFFEAGLFQASCKAAIKGGRVYNSAHIRWICDRLLKKPDKDGAVIKTCPHGRPVAFEIKKSSVERQFNRLT